jgi:hypothetical protein
LRPETRISARASPSPTISTSILFFDISLDQNNYSGTPVSSTHFDEEVDLYFNWNIANIYTSAWSVSLGLPRRPGRHSRDSKTYELTESQLIITY